MLRVSCRLCDAAASPYHNAALHKPGHVSRTCGRCAARSLRECSFREPTCRAQYQVHKPPSKLRRFRSTSPRKKHPQRNQQCRTHCRQAAKRAMETILSACSGAALASTQSRSRVQLLVAFHLQYCTQTRGRTWRTKPMIKLSSRAICTKYPAQSNNKSRPSPKSGMRLWLRNFILMTLVARPHGVRSNSSRMGWGKRSTCSHKYASRAEVLR